MRGHRTSLMLLAVLGAWLSDPAGSERAQKQPVYVGARVCATCHDGPGMGHQFSRWLLSKHAGTYAVLAQPEAKRIAALSGVPVAPEESPLCLSCHATAAKTEGWERDPG